MRFDIRPIAAHETLDLRHRVLWPSKPRTDMMLTEDEGALHYGVILRPDKPATQVQSRAGEIVGVGSFFKTPAPMVADMKWFMEGFENSICYRLRKMAIAPEHQGQGLARSLIMQASVQIKDLGAQVLWCDARVSAAGFYAKCGFNLHSDVFEKSGVDYVKASLRL